MRSFATLFAASALASTALAVPMGPWWGNADQKTCLKPSDASYLAQGYAGLITAYSAANADKFLTNDFTETSDSINTLAGLPTGGQTYTSKAAFKASQSQQAPIPFTIVSVDAVDCDSFAFRWTTTFGSGSPIKGIAIAGAANGANGWQLQTLYNEFNSINWAKDIGGSVTLPSAQH